MAIPFFFFSAWLAMVFWGMLAPGLTLPTISYPTAMLATIGLWLIVFPISRRAWIGRPFRSSRRERRRVPTEASVDTVDLSASFGGTARRIRTDNFRGGRLKARFGGVELDLRGAAIREKPARLEIDAVCGGVELKVPRTWAVQLDVITKLGGIDDDRDGPLGQAGEAPDLIVSGEITCGGLSIKD
jgi:predicted membrane protein